MRSRWFPLLYVPAFVVVLFAVSCRRAEVVWPAASPEDLADAVYVARLGEGAAEVVKVFAGGGVAELNLACDAESDVALSPDGRLLYYGLDSALHAHDIESGADRVVASFPTGVAWEAGTGEERGKMFAWRCVARFRDLTFGPEGRVAFVVEPTECPLAVGITAAPSELKPRGYFAFDAGAYLLEPGSNAPRYLRPARAVYGFVGEGALILEDKLTVARYDLGRGTVHPLLAPEAHELGWLPDAAVSGDTVVVVGAKADKRSQKVVWNRVFLVAEGRGGDEPVLTMKDEDPVTCAALSRDGRYLAVQCTPQVFGEPTIYVVDLEHKQFKVLVNGARLVAFARGSRAVFYVAGPGRAGDLYFVGLDGATRRLTSSSDVIPPP
jgi:hypothetical protein